MSPNDKPLKAGRPRSGRKPYVIRVRPATMKRIRKRVYEAGLRYPGELLERDYGKEQ